MLKVTNPQLSAKKKIPSFSSYKDTGKRPADKLILQCFSVKTFLHGISFLAAT